MSTKATLRTLGYFGILGLLAGCGERAMPVGKGATGTLTGVLEKPVLGLESINYLDPAFQESFDWMHRPIERALPLWLARPGDRELRDRLGKLWPTLPYARVLEDEAYIYGV